MSRIVSTVLALLLLTCTATAAFFVLPIGPMHRPLKEEKQNEDREIIEYQTPKEDHWKELADDQLSEKSLPKFDPALIETRPFGKDKWQINSSAAILQLDAPMLLPDRDKQLLELYPSYAAACKACASYGLTLLPSVNMIDGKAKQFDDGLYAALDLNYFQGLDNHLTSHVKFIDGLLTKVGPESPAAPYLAAGLDVAGVQRGVANESEKTKLRSAFDSNEPLSKPIAFYTWNESLKKTFCFLRYFQRPFTPLESNVQQVLAKAVAEDATLLADYKKALAFYAKLTNPYKNGSLLDLIEPAKRTAEGKSQESPNIAVFPSSGSKEGTLFDKLFGNGIPPDVNLMKELIKQVRSGSVDLSPSPKSGWYEHQVYALETLLLANKGQEKDKLLLTKAYKKRMLEAFQALITKRRETHARQFPPGMAMSQAPKFEEKLAPRLRLEPNATYYLRTARSYAFLANFLESSVSVEGLKKIHGQKQTGPRGVDLHTELHQMIQLFYGFYLVTCEDIGMKPQFAADEKVDEQKSTQLASDWLKDIQKDDDLATDSRVSIPIMTDPQRNVTRLWATLGIRMAKLTVQYAVGPSVRPANGGEWDALKGSRLIPAYYLIPVDEFAEVELRGLRSLTREELRELCDKQKTKASIIKALSE